MSDVSCELSVFSVSGDFSGGETPVPIPNTVVKPSSADDTAWETVWESRSSPGFLKGVWGQAYAGPQTPQLPFFMRSGVGASRWLARTVRMEPSRGKTQSEPWDLAHGPAWERLS